MLWQKVGDVVFDSQHKWWHIHARKAPLMQTKTCNSGACLKAQ